MASFKFNFLEETSKSVQSFCKDTQPKASSTAVLAFRADPDLAKPLYSSILSSSHSTYVFASDCSIDYIALEDLNKLLSENPDDKDLLKLMSIIEKSNSDLLPGFYEGGFKVWECTFDLLKFLKTADINFGSQRVLDLGCGAGLLGVYAQLSGASSVHFHDYNHQVLSYLTVPNLLINLAKKFNDQVEVNRIVADKTSFFCGDWSNFECILGENHMYDIILTSETIYSAQSQTKLLRIFQKFLSPYGIIFVAAKSHYFGVGGSTLLFTQLIQESKLFNYEIVEETIGLHRQIIKLTWMPLS